MAALAVRLGADVPVFVRGVASWAEGVGERLVPLDLERPWYVLIVLPFAVSTADIFRAPALTRSTPRFRISQLLPSREGIRIRPVRIEPLLAATHNDCESVVRAMHPPVGEAVDWLSQYSRREDDRHRRHGVCAVRYARAGRGGCEQGARALAGAGGERAESISAARVCGLKRGRTRTEPRGGWRLNRGEDARPTRCTDLGV